MFDRLLLSTLSAPLAPWQVMISLALAIYAASKAATWWPARHRLGMWCGAAYLLAWPGMDPRPFLTRRSLPSTALGNALAGASHVALGFLLLAAPVALTMPRPILGGLMGFVGLVLIFHFGIFHLVAVLWQCLGFDVRPIMNRPAHATSLANFWSQRWNLGFRDLAHGIVFKPLAKRCAPVFAIVGVFVFSGVVHDLVISVPAGAGYGLPTLYFLIQAAGFLAQRTKMSRQLGLATGTVGWLVTAAVVLLPAPLLFHRPFLERVMLPLVGTIHSNLISNL